MKEKSDELYELYVLCAILSQVFQLVFCKSPMFVKRRTKEMLKVMVVQALRPNFRERNRKYIERYGNMLGMRRLRPPDNYSDTLLFNA